MPSLLTFVVGVIIGLLIGWLIDLLYRRRSGSNVPQIVEPPTAQSEDVALAAGALPEAAAPVAAGAAAVRAAGVEPEQELPPVEAELSTEPEPPAELVTPAQPEPLAEPETPSDIVTLAEPEAAAAPEESQPVEWHAVSERVSEVAEEAPEAPAAHIASEPTAADEGLPPAAVAALAANQAERGAAGDHDKLILIEGIGPVYEAKLNAAGISTFRQLAEADDERLREIIEPKSWQRVNFGEWKEQARLILEGNDEELKALQARLFSRKKA